MRKHLQFLLVVALSLAFSSIFSACSYCPTCTQPEQISKDVQGLAVKAKDTYQEADKVVTDKAMEAMKPAREALEKKAYEGIEIGKKAASEVNTKLSLQATCGSASIEKKIFKANCTFIKAVNDTTEGTPTVFFIKNGKFSASDGSWTPGDNGTFNTEITVPDDAQGIVFASDKVIFVGKNINGWTNQNGDGTNYGGWLKNK